MSTRARRIAGPVIGMLLLLGALAHPALGEDHKTAPAITQATPSVYAATPAYLSIDCYQEQSGTIFCYSSSVAGLPSVSVTSASVNFCFGWAWTIYRGGGTTILQYKSDLNPTWTNMLSASESESGGTSPCDNFTGQPVSVKNLSSLNFRLYLIASTGNANAGGYALGSGTLENVEVVVP